MRAIELFAGAGGLGIGVSRAGFTPIKIVEWDKWCCDSIRDNVTRRVPTLNNWPLPIEGDVRSINFTEHDGKVDLVSGGPPCQPFSLGGKHRASKDDRDMWSEAVRVIRETKPRAFIFENVKGLTRESFASYLAYIVLQLAHPELMRRDETWEDHRRRLERHHTGKTRFSGLHYRVVYRVLNAADFGIPQRRERVVFVGFRSDLGIEWSFPTETHSQDVLLWNQLRSKVYWDRHRVPKSQRVIANRYLARAKHLDVPRSLLPWQTVRDAIGDLPDPELDPNWAKAFHNHRFQPGARAYPGHTGSPMDEPAKTLKAGVHGVPGGENMLCRSDGTVRYFTVRESARLQTFPDDFVFHGAWSESMRQLGNAVPVELGRIVAANVKQHLIQSDRVKAFS